MVDDKFLWFLAVTAGPSVIGAAMLEWLRRRRHPEAASYAQQFFRGLSCVMISLFGIAMSYVIFESIIPTTRGAAMLLLLVLGDAALGLYGVVVIRRGFGAERQGPSA